jgi:hypothetical protein
MAIFMDIFCLGHPKNIITHPFFMVILWWFYGDFHGSIGCSITHPFLGDHHLWKPPYREKTVNNSL